MKYFQVGMIAFVATYILTPYIARVGKKQNLVDTPGYRKIHRDAIPNLGGLVIFFGFLMSLLAVIPIKDEIRPFLIGGLIILLLGIVDDIVDLRPMYKFIIQMMPAILVIGYHYAAINQYISEQLSLLGVMGYLVYPLLLFWIVGVTNSINLIDGLDGLACGVSVNSLLALFLIGFMIGPKVALYNLINIAILGSMAAFFRYNFYPAHMFMGDSGSTLAGYTMATLSVLWVIFSGKILFVFIPIIILALPIFDTLFAIGRRLLSHQPIFKADQGHLHHRLLKRGLSHRNVVLILLGINAICCLLAVILGVSLL